MFRRVLYLLLVAALAVGAFPMAWALPQPVQAATPDDGGLNLDGVAADVSMGSRSKSYADMQMVPEALQAAFADGMSVDEFVEMAGYVPRALEPLVGGDALMIIELEGDPLAVQVAAARSETGRMSVASLDARLSSLQAAQAALKPQLADLGVDFISDYAVVYNGFQARVPLARLNEIRALPGVKSVHRAPIHTPALGASVELIGAYEAWQDLDVDGDGVTIAVIDTGIDYTHAALGGLGDVMAYDLNNPDVIESGTFPTAKVIAGMDFAGTLYDAGCTASEELAGICTATPLPDPDPLDEHSHGTHVSSIAAGIAAGDVMTGVAPAATLMALKVFGQDGSTSVTMDALEWATLQYLYTGKPEVINMSLGSPFGTADETDPSILATNNAVDVGIIVAAAAGNEDDNHYIVGSPGSADKAISVASSEDGYSILDGFEVTKPESLEGVHPGSQSVQYDWTSPELPVTGELVYPEVGDDPTADQRTGCYTFNLTNTEIISGNVVLLNWTEPSCGGSVARTGNAVAAGAIGVLLVDDSDVFDLSIYGSAVVPAYSIPLQIGDALKTALDSGEVEVVLTAEHQASTPYDEPTAVDIISSFSSRGPRGFDSALKPEITAPGGSIFAADMGTGDQGTNKGGTSMATPHIAGVAALLRQAHPDWTPDEIKAAMMNTAVDLVDGSPVPRSGAGRVDVVHALEPDALAIGDESLVSLSYGLLFSRDDMVSYDKHISVTNLMTDTVIDQVYDVGWAFQAGSNTAGAALTVEPSQLRFATIGTQQVTVTLDVDFEGLPADYGVVEEYYGFVTLTPVRYRLYLPLIFSGGGSAAGMSVQSSHAAADDRLRVPFYFVPRPYSQLTVDADSEIADPAADVAMIDLTHQGPISSSLWIYPTLIHNEMPDPAMQGPGDIRNFGLDYGWSGPFGDMLVVAINTWDYWQNPQPYLAEFDLYIDADQDGTDDYVDFNWNYGAIAAGVDDNDWIVVQVDLATNMLFLASPYSIYTDYNASFMEWYLPAEWQDLGPANSAFDYTLETYEEFAFQVYPTGQFDYRKPPFTWMATGDPGPADPMAMAAVAVDDLAGHYYSRPEGVMVVDYNGDPRNVNGGQAYFLPLTVGSPAYLQVAHLAPFAATDSTTVTVKLDGTTVLTDFVYGDSTAYLALDPDQYLVEVFPEGSMTAAISGTVDLDPASYYTAIATGDGTNQDLALKVLEDDLTAPVAGTFALRLGHLAPFAGGDATADIRLQDGTPVLTDVVYSQVMTTSLALPAGEYDLKITTPGGDTTLIDPLPATFASGDIVSAFATGDAANADLGVFALPAGAAGDFLPLATYLQVAHLAPFAEDAAVTVKLNGDDALTGFGYGDSTTYVPLEADEYLVEVVPTGTTTVAMSATLTLEHNKYYSAIATGDGTNQDLGLVYQEDDLTPPAAGTFHLRLGHFAPFEAGPATVDVRLQDGTPLLTDMIYTQVTLETPTPAGDYDVKITTPGGALTLIDPLTVTFASGDIVSIFGTGDDANQDPGVFALPAGQVGAFLPLADD